MSHLDFYIERAAQAEADAASATLDNVRDRCLRAQEAWSAMADRAIRTEEARAASARAKELTQAAE